MNKDAQYGLCIERSSLRDSSCDATCSKTLNVSHDARNLTILYATETGTSEEIASKFLEKAVAAGLSATCTDLADYEVESLGNEQDVVFVVSTTGEGEFPYSAADFFEYIEADSAPGLDHVRYSVLALGDSSYQHFCFAGQQLDAALERLGASRITPRIDCDTDFEEPAEKWQTLLLFALSGEKISAVENVLVVKAEASDVIVVHAAADHHELLSATILENRILVGEGSTKATRHIALALDDGAANYAPGDSLGLIASNGAAVVSGLIDALGYAAHTPVRLSVGKMSLADALAGYFEITTITPRFIEGWAELGDFTELSSLLSDENAELRAAFIYENHIIDVVRRFPVVNMEIGQFLALLRPLQPRSYSIASSLAATPNEVHLTVAPVEYQLHNEPRFGVATRYLSEIAVPGAKVQVYFQPNPHFRLPSPETPIIMVGPGTGVAPFRSFLQERSSEPNCGPAWLFFGERNKGSDFLYQAELNAFVNDGTLTHLDAVFSRDAVMHSGDEKYVQHKMLARSEELFEWIERGAHIYICGDATRMAKDVHQTLIDVIEKGLGGERKAAENYLNLMRKAGRYQRDVY